MLSKVGWERWRAWAGAASGGGGNSDDNDGGGGGDGGQGGGGSDNGGGSDGDGGGGGGGGSGGGGRVDSSREGDGDTSLVGNRQEGTKLVDHAETRLDQSGGGGLVATEGDSAAVEASLIAELASALDLHLSGSCIVLEPWDYGGVHCAEGAKLRRGRSQDVEDASFRRGASEDFGGARVKRGGKEGFKGGGGVGGGGDGAAVVVRADLSMRMTSGLFLDGHWMVELGAGAFSST